MDEKEKRMIYNVIMEKLSRDVKSLLESYDFDEMSDEEVQDEIRHKVSQQLYDVQDQTNENIRFFKKRRCLEKYIYGSVTFCMGNVEKSDRN